MSGESVSTEQTRDQTNLVIQELVEQRSKVWSLYCSVAGMAPFQPEKTIEDLLEEFCEMLVDYISLGHFGVYQRIIDGKERRRKIIDVAERLYPQIVLATESVLTFNDRYEKVTPAMILNHLADDLSVVGEQLATRIELEDELIESMVA